VDSVDIWGRRRFAYEINKKTEGIYTILYLTCEPAEVLELDRQLKLSEAVVRTKVLRAEDAVFKIGSVVVPEYTPNEEKPVRAKRSASKSAE
jgi:small subunit ribosomal protein S6